MSFTLTSTPDKLNLSWLADNCCPKSTQDNALSLSTQHKGEKNGWGVQKRMKIITKYLCHMLESNSIDKNSSP